MDEQVHDHVALQVGKARFDSVEIERKAFVVEADPVLLRAGVEGRERLREALRLQSRPNWSSVDAFAIPKHGRTRVLASTFL